MSDDTDRDAHHWPEEEVTQRVEPVRTRSQRLIRFLQEAFGVGAVANSIASPRNQDPVRNVIGIGLSDDSSREANRGSSSPD
jgi:hypothetical protein